MNELQLQAVLLYRQSVFDLLQKFKDMGIYDEITINRIMQRVSELPFRPENKGDFYDED